MTGGSITPELLLQGYAAGVFPMSEGRFDPEIFWVDPQRRGVLPLDGFRLSRSLARRMRGGMFKVTYDADFAGVLDGCADRADTWINTPIRDLYLDLHRRGFARSVEVWADGLLAGGVYGVTLGAAFFGESMFSRRRDASKLALAYLLDRLRMGGFMLFDTQFLTPHLQSLGAVEVSRATYRRMLHEALSQAADFDRQGPVPPAYEVIQRSTQTS